LAAELAAQTNIARAAGWTVNAAQAVPGGWPFAATLSVPDFLISDLLIPKGEAGAPSDHSNIVTWSTDRLVLRVGLLHPLLLGLDSEGSQHLHLGDWPEIPYTADILHAEVPLQVGVPPRGFSLRVVNLRAGLPIGEKYDESKDDKDSLTIRALTMRVSWTTAAQQNEAAVSVSLNGTALQLPTDRSWPLGSAVNSFSTDLALNGPLPRAKGLAPTGLAPKELAPAWAASWRDGGGNVELQHLVVNWGALDASGNATLALDDQMQPMGAGVLHVTDPEAALAALRDGGTIGERAELAAKALLGLMSHPAAEGGKAAVDLPVTLQDRRVSISRFGVAKIPPVVW
jgi:hypothetical protein